MTENDENADYLAEELHQRKIEKELENISSKINEQIKKNSENLEKRRRENIYVLFAIGIVGSFFTVLPKGTLTSNPIFLDSIFVFSIASAVFLVSKLLIVPFSDVAGSENIPTKIDNVSEYLFAAAVAGLIVVVGIVTAVDIFSIQVQEQSLRRTTILATVVAVSGTVLARYIIMQRRKRRFEERRRMRYLREERSDTDVIGEIVGQIEQLAELDNETERLKVHTKISENLEDLNVVNSSIEDIESIEEKMQELQSEIPDSMFELIDESISELESDIREAEMEDKTIETKLESLRQEQREERDLNEEEYFTE